jgi:hypothetical protein
MISAKAKRKEKKAKLRQDLLSVLSQRGVGQVLPEAPARWVRCPPSCQCLRCQRGGSSSILDELAPKKRRPPARRIDKKSVQEQQEEARAVAVSPVDVIETAKTLRAALRVSTAEANRLRSKVADLEVRLARAESERV